MSDYDISGGASSYNRSSYDKVRAPERIIEPRSQLHARADWTSVANGVQEMLALIDDVSTPPSQRGEPFDLARMVIHDDPFGNENTLQILAYDSTGRAFEYAIYVRGNHIDADGY